MKSMKAEKDAPALSFETPSYASTVDHLSRRQVVIIDGFRVGIISVAIILGENCGITLPLTQYNPGALIKYFAIKAKKSGGKSERRIEGRDDVREEMDRPTPHGIRVTDSV
jgi:hypothetical protein